MKVAAALIVVALSFAWYFDKPLRTTPGFYFDESSIAYNAWWIARAGVDEHNVRFPVYFEALGEYKNPVYIYLLALVFKIFGPSILAARALSIALGFLAAIVLSLLTRDTTARAFTFFAAIATPWLFETSRLVFEVAAFPLAVAIALWCVQNVGRASARLPALIGCGASFALVTYTYTAGRFIGPVMALLLLFVVPWRRAAIAWLAYAVLLIPVLLNFRAFTTRVTQVGFAKPHYFASFSPQFLFVYGDANERHHIAAGGMLFISVAIMAAVGIVAAIRKRDAWSRYLLALFVLAPLPGALAPQAPHALRLITVGVLVMVFAGIGVAALSAIQSLRLARTAVLFALLAIEALSFRARFEELGPLRIGPFDAGYPIVFDAALHMQRPPICIEEDLYVANSRWYGVLRGIDRGQLPRFFEDIEPRGTVCIGTPPVCPTCRVLAESGGFVAYRRD